MSNNILSMPLKIYYTKSWTISQISAVMSNTKLKVMNMMGIRLSILSYDKMPAGFVGESLNLDLLLPPRLKQIYRNPKHQPPARLWFIEEFIYPKDNTGKSYGTTVVEFIGNKTKSGISIINRKDHLVHKKGLDMHECSLTVAHELGHALGLEHECDKRKPGLMCTYGSHKIHPKFFLDKSSLAKVKESYLLKK